MLHLRTSRLVSYITLLNILHSEFLSPNSATVFSPRYVASTSFAQTYCRCRTHVNTMLSPRRPNFSPKRHSPKRLVAQMTVDLCTRPIRTNLIAYKKLDTFVSVSNYSISHCHHIPFGSEAVCIFTCTITSLINVPVRMATSCPDQLKVKLDSN